MKTEHTMTIDLPHGHDLVAEIEVVVSFTYTPGDPPAIELVEVQPSQPFSGPFAAFEQNWLHERTDDWLGERGREAAIAQVAIDREEGL